VLASVVIKGAGKPQAKKGHSQTPGGLSKGISYSIAPISSGIYAINYTEEV